MNTCGLEKIKSFMGKGAATSDYEFVACPLFCLIANS